MQSNSYYAMYNKRYLLNIRGIMGFILSLIFWGVIIWFGYKTIKKLLQNGTLCELFCKENKRID